MKQLKPVRDDNDRKNKEIKNKFRNSQKSVKTKINLKKSYGVLKCSKFQAQQHLFYYIF
jgi:hypothetical protein